MPDPIQPQDDKPLPPDQRVPRAPDSVASKRPSEIDDAMPATEAFDLPPSESLDDSFDTGMLAASADQTSLGRLGKYEILKVIGQGGMGVVFRGFDAVLHRPVAIKVLSRQLATSPTARRRFIREARAAAAINHPHVVTIHAVEDQEGQPYLVMEYIDGRSLHDQIRKQAPMPPSDVVQLAAQIASGLAAAHAHGVIHRDIKPANIMLEDNVQRVKITDFGLARVAQDNTDLTSHGHRLGTPAYMSPEQVTGAEIDARTDLFSLGCVMYAMLTGQSPFRGTHAFDTGRKILEEKPEPLERINPDVPPFLSEIVDRLLAKKSSSRFQSAAEVAELLNQYTTRINQTTTDKLGQFLRGGRRRSARQRNAYRVLVVASIAVVGVLTAWYWKPWVRPAAVVRAAPELDAPTLDEPAFDEPVMDDAADQPLLLGTLTVSQSGGPASGESHFRSITEALRRAGPGATIEVLDDATYSGTISISNAEQWRGITIAASHGARLTAPFAAPVIKIESTPGVTIRGFEMDAYHGQHGLEIIGSCPGTLVADLNAQRLPNAGSPALVNFVYLHAGAAGTKEEPIVLRNLTLRGGGHGIALGELRATDSDREHPVQWVRVEECTLVNPEGRTDYRLFLLNYVSDIVITRNIFADAEVGISMLQKAPHQAQRVRIHQNTFHNLSGLVTLDVDLAQDDVAITSNLMSRTDGVTPGRVPGSSLPTSWFSANAWLAQPPTADEVVAAVATIIEGVSFESEDSADDDYLRPTAESSASLRTIGDDFPGRFTSQ